MLNFKHLATVLDGAPGNPVFGSDDEKALTKSIEKAFPDSSRLNCIRHLKENCTRYLQYTLGHNDSERQKIVSCIFGADGLAETSDDMTFTLRKQATTAQVNTTAPRFIDYFDYRVVPMLQMNMNTEEKTFMD